MKISFTKKQASEIAYGTKKHPKVFVKSDPLEKDIEKKVCDHAKALGCLVYKFTSPARRSVPDRLFIMPGEKGIFFIEFKRLGCKPTPSQEVEIGKIREKGISVFVIDNIVTGRCLIADMLHGAKNVKTVLAPSANPDDY